MARHNGDMQPTGLQSHVRFPLTRLLASGGMVRVLRALFLYGGPLSVSQIASDTGMTPQGIRAALDVLVGQQIVAVLGQGRSTLYEADMRHPMAGALHQIFDVERQNWTSLISKLRGTLKLFDHIEAAWYYGSVARGEDTPASDFDIAIVVSTASAEEVADSVRDALRSIGDTACVNFSVVAIPITEVPSVADESGWWHSMAQEAIVLKGVAPDRLIAQIARRQAA